MKQLIYFMLLFPVTMMAQENKDYLLSITEFTVIQGHNEAFIEGIKAYAKCYKENNGKDKWNFWHRMQGQGNVYVITSSNENWAEFDNTVDPAAKACREIVYNLIRPHIASRKYYVTRSITEWNNGSQLPETGLVWVNYFDVKNSTIFKEVIKEIQGALKAAKDDRSASWYSMTGGDRDDVNYFVTSGYANFAGLDKDVKSVWEVYEKVNGKKKADELRDKFRSSINDIWSNIYTFKKELSN